MSLKKIAPLAFTDNRNHWELFRSSRFAMAGDGEFVVVKDFSLADLRLNDLIVDHLVFESCVLDSVVFARTTFAFETTFINCSLKNADFRGAHAASAFFYNSDLTDSVFPEYASWLSINLDGKLTPSYFIGCRMNLKLKELLQNDGAIVVDQLSDADTKTQKTIKWRLKEIKNAPILNF